jgi:hypothetical protein
MTSKPYTSGIGIGPTDELNLRVSVGALVRVLFADPRDGEILLALERKATLLKSEDGYSVEVKSQPFGGALRLLDPSALQKRVGDFHFDSEPSRAEQDFRIFVRPSHWESAQEFCLEHIRRPDTSVLEADPTRELAEEFADALRIDLEPNQYTVQAVGTIIEGHPSSTEFIHAKGYPTVRIYRIFETRILDSSLASALIRNSETRSDSELCEIALEDARQGGLGRANAVLTLPLNQLNAAYLSVPLESRNTSIWFQEHQLDATVAAVLEDVTVSKYHRLRSNQ